MLLGESGHIIIIRQAIGMEPFGMNHLLLRELGRDHFDLRFCPGQHIAFQLPEAHRHGENPCRSIGGDFRFHPKSAPLTLGAGNGLAL